MKYPELHRMQLIIAFTMIAFTCFAQNPIVLENSLAGNPKSEWDITGAGDLSIQGFATDMSVNKGGNISFKITAPSGVLYTIQIYRLGYYQGNGARMVAHLGTFIGFNQPAGITDAATGLYDCGNWTAQASWNVPSTAVSGIYIARLTRSDNNGASHIFFVVRDDQSSSPVLFKTSDATWQAYNDYGGNNLYGGTVPGYPEGHATKVSYNRPLINRRGVYPSSSIAGLTGLFNAEYAMVRWLERNGYDMTYTSCVDIAKDPKGITLDGNNLTYARKVILSVGHDEYWSKEERQKFESARNAGVNLAFFSGNEVYWKTRWENSIDSSSTPFRTLVCYKEGSVAERTCGRKCDPLPNVWTGLWRSGCEFPGTDACQPENALSGQISWEGVTSAISVPSQYKKYRLWKNTAIATLADGQSITFPNGTLGHEWDAERSDFLSTYPVHRITLSNTNVSGAIHKLSLYKYSSGALVFGAGTVQWSWGLDEVHDRTATVPNQNMQQATMNILGDMGVLPGTKQTNLITPTPSTDVSAPVVQISSPGSGSNVAANTVITISGSATDAGGEVGGVELSFDNGQTWKPANGATAWSYSYTTPSTGSVTILARAFDDSWNTGTAASTTINVTTSTSPGCPCNSLFGSTAPANTTVFNDGTALVLGMRFRSEVQGNVVGVRFYKGTNNTGTHTGLLYTNTGTLLAQVNFTNETSSGWQEANFSTPVSIQAGVSYVIAYFSGSGNYSATNFDFSTAKSTPPITGLANGTDGPNGIYRYTTTPAFPSTANASTNYWVDVLFKASTSTSDITPPVITNVVGTPNSNGTATITWTTDEASDSRVDYGTTASTLTLTGSNTIMSTSHSIILNGLAAGTTYYFRVTSKDASNNSSTSPVTSTAPLQFTMAPAPPNTCASDNLVTEFSQGITGSNTIVVNNINGEVSLKGSFTEEQFNGTTVPAGWNGGTWNAGGTTTYAGGIATLNGTRINTTASFQPGASLEFSARFSLSSFQNIGLSLNSNFDPYWIVIGRGNTTTQTDLYTRTSDGVEVSLGTGLIDAYHLFKINWTATGFDIYVDGSLRTTVNKSITTPLIFMVSDFNTDGASLSLDYFRNNNGGYPSSGIFTSRIFSLSSNPATATVSWNATVPAGTGLSIAVRSGASPTPDGTWSAFTTVTNNQSVNLSGSNIQYQASLSTSNSAASPLLNDIQFVCSGTPPPPPPPVITNVVATPNSNGTATITWTTDQPSDSRVDYGTNASSLTLNGSNIIMSTSHTITLSGLAAGTTYYFRVTSKDASNNSSTSPATSSAPLQFTMPPPPPPPPPTTQAPAVTQNPLASVNCAGSTATFSSAATGSPSPTVQWQVSTDGVNFTNLSGATIATLSFTVTTADNGKQYRAVWSNSVGIANSTAASLTVNPLPAGSLTSGTACYGQPATLTFTATAGTGPYSLVINGQTYSNVTSGSSFNTNTQVQTNTPVSLWSNSEIPRDPAVKDKQTAMEMGTKFRTTVDGSISALRFYKGNRTDNGVYKLRLYNYSTRALLTEVSYQNSNYSGWVNVNLLSAVPVSAGQLYVVTYYSPNRIYARGNNVFAIDIVNGPLIGVGTATVYGPNGVFSEGGGFPTLSGAGKAYFADVVFNPSSSAMLNFNLTAITDAKGCTVTINQNFTMAPGGNCGSSGTTKTETVSNLPSLSLHGNEGYKLEQNYPNPFNNTTTISYTIPKPEQVTIMILDQYGRTIKLVENKTQTKGKHSVNVDLGNLSKGVYLFRMQAGTFTATRKMLVE